MREYIDRNTLKEKFWDACKNCLSEDDIADLIDDIPAADVAPVVHARWVICSDGYYPYCSNCHEEPKGGPSKYCPSCGAKCDLEG